MTDLSPSRVLLIAPEPFFTPRGTPMNVAQMCRVLTSHGLRVDLATYPIGESLDLQGLTIFRAPRIPGINSVPIGFSWRKVLLDFSLSLLMLRLLIQRRYDLVHAIEESVFLMLPFSFLGVRSVYDLDSLISDQLEYSGSIRTEWLLRMIRLLERTALRRSVGAITVCQALSDSVREISPSTQIFQVEDCPLKESVRDPDQVAVEALRQQHGLKNRKAIVYTGNLESYQGMDLLLDAASLLAQSHPDAVFLLLGGTESDVESLQNQILRMGLQDSVVCLGHQPSRDLPEWMQLADVLVSPRIHGDNTPLKIYTYMYSAKPIVATNLLTHTQVLNSSVAILTPPTPEGLAAGISKVFDNPERSQQLGTRARDLARSEYSQEAFSQKLLTAYTSLLRINDRRPTVPKENVSSHDES